MKNYSCRFLFFLTLLCTTIIVGCSKDKEVSHPSPPVPVPQTTSSSLISKDSIKDIDFSYQINKIGDNHYSVDVDGNFPDGMELMVGLSNHNQITKEQNLPEDPSKMTDKQIADFMKVEYNVSEQKKTIDGKVHVEFKGKKLLAGEYVISISCSMMKLQPENIRAIFGDKGEKLTGKGVKNASIPNYGKNISFNDNLNLK